MSNGVYIIGNRNTVSSDATGVVLINCHDTEVTSDNNDSTIFNSGAASIDANGLTGAALKRRSATLTGTSNTISVYDRITLFFIDASGGNVAVTVEPGTVDRVFVRTDSTSNTATITAASGLINGLATKTLTGQYDVLVLYGDGTDMYYSAGGGGASAFTDLTDVPSSYSGEALKVVRVNAGETGLEFATISGGSLTVTQIEQNVSATPTWRGKFTVVDAGVTGTSKILIWQAFAALTGKGTLADENEMDALIVNAAAGTGQFTVYWQTQPQYVTRIKELQGNINNRPNLTNPLNDVGNYTEQVRIGKVKGNFKFNYTIS